MVAGDKTPQAIDFIKAVEYLKAKPEEEAAPFTQDEPHYSHVNKAVSTFRNELQSQTDSGSIKNINLDKTSQTAAKFLRTISQVCGDDALKHDCSILQNYLEAGTYSRLPKELKTISQEYKNNREKIFSDSRIIANRISDLVDEYHQEDSQTTDVIDFGTPAIIISETFI